MYKLFVLAATLAVANAGLLAAPAYAPAAYAAPAYASAAIGTTHESTLRSLDGTPVVSQFSKSVDTAYSSVRKSDVRVNNPGYATYAPAAYAAPAYAAPAYAAPAYAATAYARPAVAAYAAPAYHAPAVVAARPAYAAPLAARAYAAPAVAAHSSLLGVAYSPASTVAHVTYDAPLVHYGW